MAPSLMWTAEEAKYLKAVFHWQEAAASEDEKRQRQAEEEARRRQHCQPAGEFHILVIGARGTGKTSLLTRFTQGTFQDSDNNNQSDQSLHSRSHSCRHPITLKIASTPTPTPTPTLTTTSTQPTKSDVPCQTYLLDALEFPSQHLLSNPMLAQALSMTEAAVLVYSVRDRASLRLALGLAEFIREHFSSSDPLPPFSSSSHATTTKSSRERRGVTGDDDGGDEEGGRGRVYPVVLVGMKCDFPEEEEEEEDGEESAVSFAEGLKAAQGMKMPGSVSDVPFLEVSSKTGEGVERVFQVVGQEVLHARRVLRVRREQAERERMMLDLMEITKTGGGGAEGGRKRFSLWRALAVAFGRRRALVGR